ncbi:uncharacterized protein LOC121110257 [Gallus gallus]|uniref:uncharacterized protein LOC121110257 n=1 Tax=Gallus gallus TaxID=9031 RepID=UPI001F015E05|nr:uncharacterized protein LOC121110257 [Gallus gallus]
MALLREDCGDRQTDLLPPLCCQSGPPSAVLHGKKIYNSCMPCQCLKETASRHVEDFYMGFNFAPLNWKGSQLPDSYLSDYWNTKLQRTFVILPPILPVSQK